MNTIYCETTLNYAGDSDTVSVPVRIMDARQYLDEIGFEDNGFTLLQHSAAVRNWSDETEILQVHCGEIAALALEFMQCDQTVPYPPIIRSPSAAEQVADFAPIEYVHSDYTDDYRDMIQSPERSYANFISPLLAQHGLTHASLQQASRIAIVQFWRNTGPERPDRPLAFCDARTAPREMLGTQLVESYGGIKLDFETFFAFATDATNKNAWYTFPDLTAEEVVAFRTYDSAMAKRNLPFWTLHSAFCDPCAGPAPPPRQSVEMRVLCIWD